MAAGRQAPKEKQKKREAEHRKKVVKALAAFWPVLAGIATVLGLVSYLGGEREPGFWVCLGIAALALLGLWLAERWNRHRFFNLMTCAFVAFLIAAGAFEFIDPAPSPAESEAYAPERDDRVITGDRPRSIAASRDYVWVVGVDNTEPKGRLWRIDPRHLSADAEQVDSFRAIDPYDIAVGEKAVWVADGGHLIKLDPSGKEIWRDEVGAGGYNEVDIGMGHVWFKQTSPGVLFRLDPISGEVKSRIRIGPQAVALGVGLDAVWVTQKGGAKSELVRIDRRGRVIGRIDVQSDPQDVAVGADLVYVAHAQGNMVTRVDPSQGDGGRELPGEIPLEGGALPSGLDAGEDAVWISFSSSGNVFAVGDCDGEVLGDAPSGAEPLDVVVHDGHAFVPNYAGGTVSVFKLKQEPCAG
jgi:streptogramin lyase